MGVPARQLAEGEQVVLKLRPHGRVLVVPALVLIATSAVASYVAAALPPSDVRLQLRLGIALLALLVVLRWSVRPFLRWLSTTYAVTNRRVIVRRGVFSRVRRDVPLWRLDDVSVQRSLLQRMLRSGTLVVESGGEQGPLVLSDVPAVEQVRRELHRLRADAAPQRSWDSG